MTRHELESLIRLVPAPTGAKGCAHVRLDKRGKAISGGGTLSAIARALPFGGQTYLYEIKLDEPLEIYDSRQLLKAFLTNEETNVDFRVRVVARARNIEKIAESLHDASISPADIFFETINRAISSTLEKKLLNGPDSIAEHILSNREEWQSTIADRIQDLLGLETQIIFEGTQVPRTRRIRVEAIAAHFRDAPHRNFPLTVTATFEPTGDRSHESFPQTQAKQTTFLRDVVLEACLNDLTLYDYWYNRQEIEDAIRLRLDRACRHFAYRSGEIVAEARDVPRITASEQIALGIPWTGHRNRTIDFHIDTMMTLNENGAGLFDSIGRPDRRAWLAEAGATALRSAMHGRDFYNLTQSEQDALEQKIRELLTIDASRIGHRVEPVVARVMLSENRWLDKQIMEVPAADYPLKNDLVSARISATIAVRFSNIRPLVNYVDQQKTTTPATDYGEEIGNCLKELVRKTIGIVMRETETNAYFATWEKWEFPFEEDDHVIAGNRNYVRNQLVHAIRKELGQRFTYESCDVRLHRDNGQLGEIIEHLQRMKTIALAGEVIPDDAESDAEFLPYSMLVKISDVQADQWANVLRRGIAHISPENLKTGLELAAREFLGGRLQQELEELNFGVRATPGAEATKHALETYVNNHMVRHYGLTCAIEGIEIKRSVTRQAVDTHRGLRSRAILAEAQRARRQIENSAAVDDVTSGYEAARIKDLQQSIRNNPRRTDADLIAYNRDKRELDSELEKLARREAQTFGRIASIAPPEIAGTSTQPEQEPERAATSTEPPAAPGTSGHPSEI